MGFRAPLTYPQARGYWLSLGADLHSGSRLLLVASSEDRIVGSGQLVFSPWSSLKHWAELQKVFVAPARRERGLGRLLVTTLHAAARDRRRSLLVLSTRHGEPAEALYKKMGYREVDVVRGGAAGPTTQRYALVTLYKELSL
jgi:GNAT superfamily N-acetyltransferase